MILIHFLFIFVAIILEEYLYFECATYLISIKLIAPIVTIIKIK